MTKQKKITKKTTRVYVSKSYTNRMLKTGGVLTIFLPGGGTVGKLVKVALGIFGIWKTVPGGFRFDVTKIKNYRSNHVLWYHNFHWQ